MTQDTNRLIDLMIKQGRNSEEIAAATGVYEHHILGRMKDIAKAEQR